MTLRGSLLHAPMQLNETESKQSSTRPRRANSHNGKKRISSGLLPPLMPKLAILMRPSSIRNRQWNRVVTIRTGSRWKGVLNFIGTESRIGNEIDSNASVCAHSRKTVTNQMVKASTRPAIMSVRDLLSEDEWKSSARVPETQSAYHPHAQRNAFRRRDAHQQSRSCAPGNQWLRCSPNSNPLCTDCQRLCNS